MYSGNMGAPHDLESVVIAAKRLQDVSDIKFIFIGDGAKRDKIARMAEEMQLRNFLLLPYQLRDVLPFSLTCGDASIVTLEPGAEGLSVPSKVYSSLAAGQAVLAIMGETCDVVDIIEEGECGQRISPGDVDGLVNAIRHLHDNPTLLQNTKENARICFDVNFSKTRAIDSYERVLRQATTK
jgi:glycosyltransferase involved in cell wall biosynthesis